MADFSSAHTVRIPVAWGEMDAFRHVNNTAYLRWFETARIEWFAKVGFAQSDGVGPILARTEIDYRAPLTWPDTVDVSIGVVSVGRSSVTLGYEVRSDKLGAVAARGVTVIVQFDYGSGKSVPLDDAMRARIGPAPAG